ncbi:MAG: hypothetical protein JSW11_22085 [Candidatus Heimdallarchaeota archaeon]|nr:MAG: hypothetical protein JSW11_22085 [Candidatus Heimdallarchaeota archaeon]
MSERHKIRSKHQNFVQYYPIWLVIWYFLGFIYVLISVFPSVSNWSIQESITREGTFFVGSYNIESGSIVEALFLSILWPIFPMILYTFGWMLAGEFVGFEFDPSSPIILVFYYLKLTQYNLPIFVIGFVSGFIVLIFVKRESLFSRLKKKPN